MIVRKFHEDNAEKVSAMIIHTLKTSNSKDYSAEDINALEKQMQPAGILERASWTHFYVPKKATTSSAAARSDLIGAARRKAACSRSLFCPRVRAKASAEKSSKRLNRTNFSSEQSASRFPRRSRLLSFTESLAMNTKTALTVLTRSGYTVWKSIDDLTPVSPRVALCAIC